MFFWRGPCYEWYFCSWACGIEEAGKFVITGGLQGQIDATALKTVISYKKTGEAEILPELSVPRYRHACGSFITDKGDYVRFILNINKHWTFLMQVLLVTGGQKQRDGSLNFDLALKSTEVLEAGGSWRQTGSLPSARFGLRAAVLDNNIFVFGENIFCYISFYYWTSHCI